MENKKSAGILIGLIAAVAAATGVCYWILADEMLSGDIFSWKLLAAAVVYYAAMLTLLWYSARFKGAQKWWLGAVGVEAALVLAAVVITNTFAKMHLFLACLLVFSPHAVFLPIIANSENAAAIIYIALGLIVIHIIFAAVFCISKKSYKK